MSNMKVFVLMLCLLSFSVNAKDGKPLDVAPGTGWSVKLKHNTKVDLSTAVMLRIDDK